jgi:hypothetical protein
VHGEKESSSSNARRRRRTAGHHGDMMIDDVAVSHFGKKILRDSKGALCFSGPFYHKGRKSAWTQKNCQDLVDPIDWMPRHPLE